MNALSSLVRWFVAASLCCSRRSQPVYVFASRNRLEKLLPELVRRFDTIVFADLPYADIGQFQNKKISKCHNLSG
jgi:SpoVK/Ycf46/Vps4 family AAA+-type ATPase